MNKLTKTRDKMRAERMVEVKSTRHLESHRMRNYAERLTTISYYDYELQLFKQRSHLELFINKYTPVEYPILLVDPMYRLKISLPFVNRYLLFPYIGADNNVVIYRYQSVQKFIDIFEYEVKTNSFFNYTDPVKVSNFKLPIDDKCKSCSILRLFRDNSTGKTIVLVKQLYLTNYYWKFDRDLLRRGYDRNPLIKYFIYVIGDENVKINVPKQIVGKFLNRKNTVHYNNGDIHVFNRFNEGYMYIGLNFTWYNDPILKIN